MEFGKLNQIFFQQEKQEFLSEIARLSPVDSASNPFVIYLENSIWIVYFAYYH